MSAQAPARPAPTPGRRARGRPTRRRDGGRPVRRLLAVAALALAGSITGALPATAASTPSYVVDLPDQFLTGVPTSVTVSLTDAAASGAADEVVLAVAGQEYPLEFTDGEAAAEVEVSGPEPEVQLLMAGAPQPFLTSPEAVEEVTDAAAATTLPGWVSVLPPLVAIVVALVTRQVLPALFLGIWVGAWALEGFGLNGLWSGLLAVPNVWVLEAIAPPDGDTSHASIVVFTMLIGGLVGIISCNGGTPGSSRPSPGSRRTAVAGRP